MERTVLAVGAHWDDIELGCGLTLLRLQKEARVIGVVLTDSEYAIPENGHARRADVAWDEGQGSFEELAITSVKVSTQPAGSLTYNVLQMQELEALAEKYTVDTVFTHWHGDTNTDHAATWAISKTAFRNIPNFLMYQSNSYYDAACPFAPQLFFSFSKSEYLHKEKILQRHETEWNHRQKRWKREIFEKERYWGYLCRSDYAEGFMVSRLVNHGSGSLF